MRRLIALFFLLFTFLYSIQSSAAVVVAMINPPPPKEVIIVPRGNLNCVITPAGIYNGIYVSAHKVCRYSNSSKKIIWIAGHWECQNFRPMRGVCLSWIWIPNRWTARV